MLLRVNLASHTYRPNCNLKFMLVFLPLTMIRDKSIRVTTCNVQTANHNIVFKPRAARARPCAYSVILHSGLPLVGWVHYMSRDQKYTKIHYFSIEISQKVFLIINSCRIST